MFKCSEKLTEQAASQEYKGKKIEESDANVGDEEDLKVRKRCPLIVFVLLVRHLSNVLQFYFCITLIIFNSTCSQ